MLHLSVVLLLATPSPAFSAPAPHSHTVLAASAPVAATLPAQVARIRKRFLGEFGGINPGGGSAGGRMRPKDQTRPRRKERGVPGSYKGPGGGAAPTPRSGPAGGPAQPRSSQVPHQPIQSVTGTVSVDIVPIDWLSYWDHNQEPYLHAMRLLRERLFPDTGSGSDSGERGGRPTPAETASRVVPFLRHILEEDPAPPITSAVLLALGRVGEPPGATSSPLTELLVSYLADDELAIVESVCLGLGALQRPEAIPHLVELLHNEKSARRLLGRSEVPIRIRAFSAYALGMCADGSDDDAVRRRVVDALLLSLGERDATRQIHGACVVALGGIGPYAADGAQKTTRKRSSARSTAELAERLLDIFEAGRLDDVIRAHAATSLASQSEHLVPEARDEIVKALTKALGSRSREPRRIRQSCALALGFVGDADLDKTDVAARKALVESLGDADLLTRYYALVSLARVGSRPGSGMRSGQASGEGDAFAATPDIRRILLERLARAKTIEKPWVALALGLFGNGLAEERRPLDEAELSALRSSLADARSPEVVAAHALALGLLRDERGRATIAETLAEAQDPAVEGACALGIGMLFTPSGAPPVMELLQRSLYEPLVLEQATIGLGLLAYPTVVSDLAELGKESVGLLTATSLLNAYGHSRDRRAITPLLDAAANSTAMDLEIAWAVTALGELCEKDELPFTSRVSTRVNTWIGPPSLTDLDGFGFLDVR